MGCYECEKDFELNITTALLMLRDLGANNDIPINIQLDGLCITVIVNFGKRDSRIHRFYLQDMYRYEAKFDHIYCRIRDDINEIVSSRDDIKLDAKED